MLHHAPERRVGVTARYNLKIAPKNCGMTWDGKQQATHWPGLHNGAGEQSITVRFDGFDS